MSLIIVALHPAIHAVRVPIAVPVERQFELLRSAIDPRRHWRPNARNRGGRLAISRCVVGILEILELWMNFGLFFELRDTGSLGKG